MRDLHPDAIEFLSIIDEMSTLSMNKQQDYGKDDSPFANVMASEDFGIPAWIGCSIRMGDKFRRIQKAAVSGVDSLKYDSVEDDFIDLAVYSAIGLLLVRKMRRASVSDD